MNTKYNTKLHTYLNPSRMDGMFASKSCTLLRSLAGHAIILPPMLTFYNGCRTTDEQVDHVVGKILM